MVIASDHAGHALRGAIAAHLQAGGHTFDDLGLGSAGHVDYPHVAATLARRVRQRPGAMGILICGTGLGMSMAANRVVGIRAAVCTCPWMAVMARRHNDANVLCLGGRMVGDALATAIVDAFVATRFDGGRHAARIAQLDAIGSRP